MAEQDELGQVGRETLKGAFLPVADVGPDIRG